MVTHVGQRFCSRCKKELTDAASQEVGVGPICRHLDNKLMACQIPANIGAARLSFAQVGLGDLPAECTSTFLKVEESLTESEAETRQDWRETVKRIEWLRSFSTLSTTAMDALLGVAFSLGYIGLVSLWKGEAATGETTVWFADGRIFVKGPRNSGANHAFKKAGAKFHGDWGTPAMLDGKKVKAWSLPADKHETAHTLVFTHYPNHKGLDESLTAAQSWQPTTAPAASTPAVEDKPQPKVFVTVSGSWLQIKSPYSGQFIAAIKALPIKDRKWNPGEKVWEVLNTHQSEVETIVSTCFGEQVALS